MAEEEATPAYINYGEAEAGDYEGKDLTRYFQVALSKLGVSWRPTVKDSSLAKRMVKEYSQNECEKITDNWLITAKREHIHAFSYMYTNRHTIATKLFKPEDYGWD